MADDRQKKRHRSPMITGGVALVLAWGLNGPATIAQESRPSERLPALCGQIHPHLESLIPFLLEDLPDYTNRVRSRRRLSGIIIPKVSTIAAGPLASEPLPLANQGYTPQFPDTTTQVFFQTLERQYGDRRITTSKTSHWYFLTPTDQGWQTVFSFQRRAIGDQGPLLPLEDSSTSVTHQAVDLWLRDCFALEGIYQKAPSAPRAGD